MKKVYTLVAVTAYSLGWSLPCAEAQIVATDLEIPTSGGTALCLNHGSGALSFHLSAHNIWAVGYLGLPSEICVVKFDNSTGGDRDVLPSSGVKYLVQHDDPSSTNDNQLVFLFSQPVHSFSFTRPQLDGTMLDPVVFPAWTLYAADGSGTVDSVSALEVIATSVVNAQQYTVSFCGIEGVRFVWSNSAAVNTPGLIIDDLSMSLLGCGSADFDGDGDSGTDEDVEAFFECIGGDCCATCGSADFDGDCDLGTNGDIEAFFRVLGGLGC